MTSYPRRKVALITGATGGIGKATAIALAREQKYDFALHYNSASEETCLALQAEIEGIDPSRPTRVYFFKADLSEYDGVRHLYAQVISDFGGIDVLFNNAGSTAGQSGTTNLAEVSIDIFEKTWRTNTGSGILLTQLCLPHMEARDWGRIIFCSSVAAFTGGVVGPHYASSKSAQHGFIHWLAGNTAKKGITVNGVAPALIGDTVMMGSSEDEETQKKAEKIPVGRIGRPEEIAETVVWMVRNGYVTNKVITVDGGLYPY